MAYEPDRYDTLIASIGKVNVYACGVLDYITIDDGVCNHPEIDDGATLTREEAIAAAKAILKHFNVDYNAYEDNISNRYRQLTQDEMKKLYEDNPLITLIPANIYDPDAPLTSELTYNWRNDDTH